MLAIGAMHFSRGTVTVMPRTNTESDAITCYILSQKQGVKMIAALMGITEEEVKALIKQGERLMKARGEDTKDPVR